MSFKRLYENFSPEYYNLYLDLSDAKNRHFSGKVDIKGEAKAIKTISLHTKELAIDKIYLKDDRGLAFELLPDNDELKVYLPDLDNDIVEFSIEFSGKITDSMHGMYPCYYTYEGETKELIATQFESHHAREVFPCVDEPEAKAVFDLTIKAADGQEIISGTPISSSEIQQKNKITTFNTTPKMSTYLLAFVLGDLHKKTATTKDGVEVSVWATRAQHSELFDFPLDIAVRVLEFYEEYFGVKFPLKKCGHVALPDFASGAMENWGLITYRESALLAGQKSALSSKRHVALVIAHETAHQWFGNLVTMKWWDDLWLNESFATMMEYFSVDAIEPSWNIWQEFSVNEAILSLRRDAIDGVQSVHIPVNHPDEIGTIFDGAIVYAKGARLMNMLRVFVGDEAFRDGLQNYFKKFAYQNTVGADLWRCLSDSSGEDVAKFMDAWLAQPGYPVVDFSRLAEDKFKLTQSQFFVGQGKDVGRIWPILLRSNQTNFPHLLDSKELVFEAELSVDDDYAQLNHGNVSHFITNYSSDLYIKLLKAVTAGKLDDISRLQILQERSLLARGNKISSADLLKTLRFYSNESSLSVWDMIGILLGDLKIFIDPDSEAEQKMREFVGNLARKEFLRLGIHKKDGENEEDTQLRPSIISHMIYAKDRAAIDQALQIYHQADNVSDIDAEIRSIVLAVKVQEDESPELISQLLQIYKTTADVDLRDDISSALTCTRNSETGKLLLSLMTNNEIVRPQDVLRWYIYLLRNHKTRNETWDWARDNWPWITKTFGSDKDYNDFPRYSGAVLRTQKHLEEFREFFDPMMDDPSLTRAIEMGEREIESRVKLIERDKAAVEAELFSESI